MERTLTAELHVDGLDRLALRVRGFAVEEALSRLQEARVEADALEAVGPEALLDKAATLILEMGETRRTFHGLVIAAGVERMRENAYRVGVVVAPRLWRAGLGRSSRIFQEKSLPDVVKTLLQENGVDRADWKLKETQPAHSFVVQREESDLGFASRLLGEAGIGFAFRQGEESEELVFFDDSTGLPPIDGEATLLDRRATQLDAESAWEVRERRVVTSDAVALKDYDLRRPRLDLSAREETENGTGREVYLHPGGFEELPEGRRRARARLQRLRVAARVFAGRSSCPRLEPGRTFTLQGHPRTSHNVDHLVVAVRHRGLLPAEGEGGSRIYENAFESIPASVPWRPPVEAGEPVRGPQLAFVTCPPGEEIHCDDYGRVKALLNFDRHSPDDDRSSTWMRVGQLALGGAVVLPRKGFEVLVDFELGDVDRPFVAGHLYNGEARPPYALPADRTRSSIQSATTAGGAGANELRFEDTAGREEILLNASRDVSVTVQNDASELVASDQKHAVVGSRTVIVGEDLRANVAKSRKLTVGATQEIKIGGPLSDGVGGAESVTVGATRRLEVGGDKVDEVKGSFRRTVGAIEVVTAIGGVQRNTVGSSSVDVGAAWAELVGGSRMSSCGGNRTESTGALKLIKAKQLKVTAGGNFTALVAGLLSTKCGGGRSDSSGGPLIVTAGGGLSVKADSIVIEARSLLSLVAGSVSITLTAGGTISILAPKIDLRGVEQLSQVMHKSN